MRRRGWYKNGKVTEKEASKRCLCSFSFKKHKYVCSCIWTQPFEDNWKNKKSVCVLLMLSVWIVSSEHSDTARPLHLQLSHVYSSLMKSLLLPQTSCVALYRDTACSFSMWVQAAPATTLCLCVCVCGTTGGLTVYALCCCPSGYFFIR